MTLEKGDDAQNERRKNLLLKVAKVAVKMGQFHLATKKFTQAGDKIRAMKSLLRSGDTDRIIFFAQVSRSREIFVLAANYLQSLDWHNDPEVMKSIIQFYSKARAYDRLAAFYEACAQLEVDEYRDYAKAMGALKEAKKCIARAALPDSERRVEQLQQRIALVDRFVQARKLVREDPQEMVRICQELLDMPDIEAAVRAGDVFAALVELFVARGEWQQAYRTIERMQQRRIELAPYLEQELINNVYAQVGVAPPGAAEQDSGVVDEEEVVDDGDELM